jgi:hypothetical protein
MGLLWLLPNGMRCAKVENCTCLFCWSVSSPYSWRRIDEWWMMNKDKEALCHQQGNGTVCVVNSTGLGKEDGLSQLRHFTNKEKETQKSHDKSRGEPMIPCGHSGLRFHISSSERPSLPTSNVSLQQSGWQTFHVNGHTGATRQNPRYAHSRGNMHNSFDEIWNRTE